MEEASFALPRELWRMVWERFWWRWLWWVATEWPRAVAQDWRREDTSLPEEETGEGGAEGICTTVVNAAAHCRSFMNYKQGLSRT